MPEVTDDNVDIALAAKLNVLIEGIADHKLAYGAEEALSMEIVADIVRLVRREIRREAGPLA